MWDNGTNMAWHGLNYTLQVPLRLVRWHVHLGFGMCMRMRMLRYPTPEVPLPPTWKSARCMSSSSIAFSLVVYARHIARKPGVLGCQGVRGLGVER